MKKKWSLRVARVVPLSLALAIGFSGTPTSQAVAAEPANAQHGESEAPAAKKDLSRYKKVLLLPAELVSEEVAEFKGVPVPGRLAMAAYLTEAVADLLKEKGLLAKRPGPGVAQLRLVVNDLEMTGKGASAAPSLPPFPMAPELPELPGDGPGKSTPRTATASVIARFTDSQSGETVATLMTRETAKGGFLDALPKAIDKVVQKVGNRLEQNAGTHRGNGDAE